MQPVKLLLCFLLLELTAALPVNAQASTISLVARPSTQADQTMVLWLLGIGVGLLGLAVLFVLFLLAKDWRAPTKTDTPVSEIAPILFIQRGEQAGKTIILEKIPCRLGQDGSNDICLNDPRVSRQHAQILPLEGGYGVMDLGSKEGTFVNGKVIKEQPVALRPGDIIRLGGTVLIFGE